MTRAIWLGVITFGLVSVPAGLYTTTEDHHTGLKLTIIVDTWVSDHYGDPHAEVHSRQCVPSIPRAELDQRASEQDLAGRSKMSREEFIDALTRSRHRRKASAA
ncbi:hypothetical protein A6P39_041350 [Streptomyces sp. FXJ1.172]|uniref:hypothetical protein n=1 Tax=Streptomyces sp. FXJ1.172 TaxID=710705 RepID=UPI0007CFEE6D|nr:hypothetical protein [Streptomyces sp. FXJ1.172]WEO99958.1 hypothetical protein A6P39_041350 [Streptomyces sp. FXJ1.172]